MLLEALGLQLLDLLWVGIVVALVGIGFEILKYLHVDLMVGMLDWGLGQKLGLELEGLAEGPVVDVVAGIVGNAAP